MNLGMKRGKIREDKEPWNGYITREHDRQLQSIERATGLRQNISNNKVLDIT